MTRTQRKYCAIALLVFYEPYNSTGDIDKTEVEEHESRSEPSEDNGDGAIRPVKSVVRDAEERRVRDVWRHRSQEPQ
jgi:hypothetical protein